MDVAAMVAEFVGLNTIAKLRPLTEEELERRAALKAQLIQAQRTAPTPPRQPAAQRDPRAP